MKTVYIFALVILVFGSLDSVASLARVNALNLGGSLLFPDDRNVFLNPAQVNNFSNLLVLEMSQPEGLVTKKSGSSVFGLIVGRTPTSESNINSINGLTANNYGLPNNAVELIWGNGSGLGASLLYAGIVDNSAFGNDQKATNITARVGFISGGLQGYLRADVIQTGTTTISPTQENRYKGNFPLLINLTNQFSESWLMELAAEYKRLTSVDSTGAEDFEYKEIDVSLANLNWISLSNSTRIFLSEALFYQDARSLNRLTTISTDNDFLYLFLTVGIESQLNSWLTLYGSLIQSVGLAETLTTVKDSNTAQTTDIDLGARFQAGEFKVDGSISAENGVFETDNLLGTLSLLYNF